MIKRFVTSVHPLVYISLFFLTGPMYTYINEAKFDQTVVDVTIKMDDYIPFIEEFIIPYILWYPFMYGLLIYYCFVSRKEYFVGLSSMVIGKLICFCVYCVWQTTVPRPEVVGDDIFAQLVRFIYSQDEPVNCLPSIHVLTTLIMMILAFRRRESHKWEAMLVFVVGILIIISTLFTKQHAILDVFAGIILAFIVYAAVQYVFVEKRKFEVSRYVIKEVRNKHF